MSLVAGVVKDLSAVVLTFADSLPKTTGTVTVIVRLELDGDGDDGKHWDTDSGGSWQTTPTTYPTATHVANGVWLYQLPAAATTGHGGGSIVYHMTDNKATPASTTSISGIFEHRITVQDELTTTDLDAATVAVDSISANVITATAIAANAITSAKIATDAIGSAQIATNAIGSDELATDCITSAELATSAINEIRDSILTDSASFNGGDIPLILANTQGLSTVGSAVNTPAESYNATLGTPTNDYTDTAALDGVYHQHADAAGAIDIYYQFDIGGDGIPTSVTVTGRIEGSNDDLDGVYAYDWSGTSWDRLGDFDGQVSTPDEVRSYNLYTSHVGTGANLGKVRVRFWAASGLTSATLYIDQIFLSYAIVSRTVGYSNGSIWIDTNASNTNTEPYVDGTADNQVSTWAAALTLSGSLGIEHFHIANGSTITLTGASDNYTFVGTGWNLALGGQSVTNTSVTGAQITGTGIGGTLIADCCIFSNGSAMTVHSLRSRNSCLAGDLILTGATASFLVDCHSAVAGTSTPSVDFGAAVGDTQFNLRNYSGGVELRNMGAAGTDNASIEGQGQVVLAASCAGGTLAIRGCFTITDNAGGAVTLSDDARLSRLQVESFVWDATQASYVTAGTTGETLSNADTSSLPTLNAIIDGVLDEDTASHAGAGTVGLAISDGGGLDAAATAAAVWDATMSSYVDGGSTGEALNSAAAAGVTGTRTITFNARDGSSNAIPTTSISIYDSANSVLITRVTTDINGNATASLDDATYTLRVFRAGYSFSAAQTMVVTADATVTATGTAVAVSSPVTATGCVVNGYLFYGATAHEGVTVKMYEIVTPPQKASSIIMTGKILSTTTDSNGYFEIEMVQSTTIGVEIPEAGVRLRVDLPAETTYDLSEEIS